MPSRGWLFGNSTTPTKVRHLAADSIAVPAATVYRQNSEQNAAQIAELAQRQGKLVWVRTILFLGSAFFLLTGYTAEENRLFFQVAGWCCFVAFIAAIVWHEHLRLARLQQEAQARLYLRLLARLDRDWDKLPAPALLPEFADVNHCDDLDVAGPASLLSFISLAATIPGQRCLQSWLLQTTDWHTVEERQAAVRTLCQQRELRLGITQTIHSCSDGTEDVYALPEWATTPSWLAQHRVAHSLSYIGPILVIVGAAALLLSSSSGFQWLLNAAAIAIGFGFLINIFLTVFWGSWIHEIFHQAAGRHGAVIGFASVFDEFGQLEGDSRLIKEIRAASVEGPLCANRGFAKLLQYIRLASLQRDPLLYFLYLALQLIFAWDFRILKLLEGWKKQFGSEVSNWFNALGTGEAICSVATLADEYREWAFPEPPDSTQQIIMAKRLGHPLLTDAARVANDLEMLREKPLLLVTGSNMAGKSTFMRAVGLNLLLARAGAPVCAERLQTPLFELATSIRVRDSLKDGVSFFMAELQRLKQVVDTAANNASSVENPIFFLLDEVLQGTNSRERQIAVASVVESLLAYGATGMLSTHDLDLAGEERIQNVGQIVHFREYFEQQAGKEVMRFDYLMRPGPTPTTNALRLLEFVGLQQPGK